MSPNPFCNRIIVLFVLTHCVDVMSKCLNWQDVLPKCTAGCGLIFGEKSVTPQ